LTQANPESDERMVVHPPIVLNGGQPSCQY
jgi:hypothetical protein